MLSIGTISYIALDQKSFSADAPARFTAVSLSDNSLKSLSMDQSSYSASSSDMSYKDASLLVTLASSRNSDFALLITLRSSCNFLSCISCLAKIFCTSVEEILTVMNSYATKAQNKDKALRILLLIHQELQA